MSIAWSVIESVIRDRIEDPDAQSVTQAEALRTFNEVYRQWWARFGKRMEEHCNLGQLDASGREKNLVTMPANVAEVKRIYFNNAGTGEWPEWASLPEAELVDFDVVRDMYDAEENDSISPAAGMPQSPSSGCPKYAAIYRTKRWNTGNTIGTIQWYLFYYPTSDLTYGVLGVVVRFPTDVDATSSPDCNDDEAMGLANLTALRLLPKVGRQNDQGIVNVILSAIPAHMRELAPTPVDPTRRELMTDRQGV